MKTTARIKVDTVSDKEHGDEFAQLERINEELSDSLKLCRKMLRDYEARLAANGNEPQPTTAGISETKASSTQPPL